MPLSVVSDLYTKEVHSETTYLRQGISSPAFILVICAVGRNNLKIAHFPQR